MAEVKWQARRISDGVLVDVTGDTENTPAVAPTANALEGAGGGAVTVTDGAITVTDVTTLQVPAATAGAAGTAVIGPVSVSLTDPGAVGPGQLWLRYDSGANLVLGLFVRNGTDDGWINSGAGSLAIDAPADAVNRLLVLDDDRSTYAALILVASNGPDTSGLITIAVNEQDGNNYEGAAIRMGAIAANDLELVVNNITTGALIAGITLNATGLSLPGLPTSNPGPGLLWNDANTLKIGT